VARTFADAAKEAGIPRDRLRQLGGWAGGGGIEDMYGSGLSVPTLFAEITKITYPITLNHLRPSSINRSI
jgi:hypothetical protein